MTEPLTDEELAEFRLAVEMDTEFTSRMEPGATEGPAITHHLLYVTRKYGPRLLASIEATEAKARRDFPLLPRAARTSHGSPKPIWQKRR